MKRLLQNLSLLFASILISIVIAEFVTRLIHPMPVGLKMLTIDGQPISRGDIMAPGLTYRLVNSEYDVVVTITDQRYRVPLVKDNPNIIFVGDSFTFGVGLNDEETFVYQYCNALDISCANLGRPGTGTILQMKRLEKYLTNQNWRPKKVYLYIYAMTSFLSHGNDLSDNLRYNNKLYNKNTTQKILTLRNKLYQHSNLVRIMYNYFGTELRTIFSAKSRVNRVNKALEITKQQLGKLDRLSSTFGFEFEIFLFHPMQDITRKTYKDTLKDLQRISPVTIHGTGHLFENDTRNYYYPADGHFNAYGAKKITEFLLSRDSRK